jgi:nicotinate-nucleotide pyrophosphorylase
MCDLVGERAITGEQQQSFRIIIEASGGIDIRHVDEVREGLTALITVGELRQNAVGLV